MQRHQPPSSENSDFLSFSCSALGSSVGGFGVLKTSRAEGFLKMLFSASGVLHMSRDDDRLSFDDLRSLEFRRLPLRPNVSSSSTCHLVDTLSPPTAPSVATDDVTSVLLIFSTRLSARGNVEAVVTLSCCCGGCREVADSDVDSDADEEDIVDVANGNCGLYGESLVYESPRSLSGSLTSKNAKRKF